mgnify:CR=1 FL=1
MEVRKGKKSLYHIQTMNMGSDGYPFDVFVFNDHFPTKEDLLKVYKSEYGGTSWENDEALINEFLTSSEIYKVYAEEV